MTLQRGSKKTVLVPKADTAVCAEEAKRIVIVGGGICGLATALSLASRGIKVIVLERNDQFSELGAGIQLAPNAFRALDILGVGEEARECATHVSALRLMDGISGNVIAVMPLGADYRQRFGNPYAVVHRGDLHGVLLTACQKNALVELRAASEVIGFQQVGDSVSAVLSTGESFAGEALIGADGIRSVIRAQLLSDGVPRVSGHTIYRSLLPMERVPASVDVSTVTLWAGPRWHFVHYTIAGGKFLNVAVTKDNNAQTAVNGATVEASDVLAEFQDLTGDPDRILRACNEWRTWVLCDRDPVACWSSGRVILLGDAAHPMLQYAAQGACMALEDAVCLGEMLDCTDDISDRLMEFVATREPRTSRVQLISRAMGDDVYHPEGEQAMERNAYFAGLTTQDMYDEVEWLHGLKIAASR